MVKSLEFLTVFSQGIDFIYSISLVKFWVERNLDSQSIELMFLIKLVFWNLILLLDDLSNYMLIHIFD